MKTRTLAEIRSDLTKACRSLRTVEKLREINVDLLISTQDDMILSKIADNAEFTTLEFIRNAIG